MVKPLTSDPFIWYITMIIIAMLILSMFFGNIIFIAVVTFISCLIVNKYEKSVSGVKKTYDKKQ